MDKKIQSTDKKIQKTVSNLSEEDVTLHKENTVKNLPTFWISKHFIDILSTGIDYKIAIENFPVLDVIAGIENTTKTFPTVSASNILCYDCCNIL